ncbi:MAG: Rieske (2Fe-2S) protein [Candidatus Dormibacterales bacterium]
MSWYTVGKRRDVPADRGWPVQVGDRRIAVFAVGADLFAVDNVCRHVGNPIDDGHVEHGCVTCPWHGWRYDLRTGDQVMMFGRRPGLRTYPVRSAGEDVQVDIS